MISKTIRPFIALVALSFTLLFAVEACKQGEGEICQINSDCSGDLICNAATGKCQAQGGGIPDAGPDAMDVPIDAAVDAMPDAMPDAAPDAMP